MRLKSIGLIVVALLLAACGGNTEFSSSNGNIAGGEPQTASPVASGKRYTFKCRRWASLSFHEFRRIRPGIHGGYRGAKGIHSSSVA